MPQTIILKGQQHAFAGGIIPGNVTATTTNPATGNVTYTLAAQGPVVVPFAGNQVHSFVLPVNGNTLTTTNPATGNVTYTLAAMGPIVVPFVGNQVHTFVLPVNGNPLGVFNNSTSGLSCVY